MTDTAASDDEPAIKLFGDPRSKFVERGPDRRRSDTGSSPVLAATSPEVTPRSATPPSATRRTLEPTHALRLGRGDSVSTVLSVLGVLVFGSTIIAGTLILYNAKDVGAFRNPWNSTRVAIGLAVLAVGIVQSAILIGLSRVTAYLLAILRMRAFDHESEG